MGVVLASSLSKKIGSQTTCQPPSVKNQLPSQHVLHSTHGSVCIFPLFAPLLSEENGRVLNALPKPSPSNYRRGTDFHLLPPALSTRGPCLLSVVRLTRSQEAEGVWVSVQRWRGKTPTTTRGQRDRLKAVTKDRRANQQGAQRRYGDVLLSYGRAGAPGVCWPGSRRHPWVLPLV